MGANQTPAQVKSVLQAVICLPSRSVSVTTLDERREDCEGWGEGGSGRDNSGAQSASQPAHGRNMAQTLPNGFEHITVSRTAMGPTGCEIADRQFVLSHASAAAG